MGVFSRAFESKHFRYRYQRYRLSIFRFFIAKAEVGAYHCRGVSAPEIGRGYWGLVLQ